MSRKAAEYGQLLPLALLRRVVRTNTASTVLLPFLNPNCSGPNNPAVSAASVIRAHILTVSSLRMLDGMVIGLYWPGWSESPPWVKHLQCTWAKC